MTKRMPLAAKHSVPSALIGERQGGKWPQAIASRSLSRATTTLLSYALRGVGNRRHGDSWLPPSPTLPHKGGGSDGDSRLGHRATSRGYSA